MAIAQGDSKAVALDAIKRAGFPESEWDTALKVAAAESGLDPKAVNNANKNGTSDFGLFQINSIHKPTALEKTDPYANAKRAYSIWKDAGNKWTPWAAFNNGSYKGKDGTGGIPSPGEALGSAVAGGFDPLATTKAAIQSFLDKVEEFLNLWYMILIGLILIIIGLVILSRDKVAGIAVKAATKGLVNGKTIKQVSKVVKGVSK